MPRGVAAVGETRAEAERGVLEGSTQLRILRSREIDMTGLPPLATGPVPRHWVVVVEHEDPLEEAKLIQHADPEGECERETRLLYLRLALDPESLVIGEHEEFPCPGCGKRVHLDMPPKHARRPRTGAACPSCKAPLTRATEADTWAVAPPPRKAAARCVFCDEKADSYEHVVPRWISKRLGLRNVLSADKAFIVGSDSSPTRPISLASYRARIFCTGCNTHFKHLEDAVIPLLVPMAKGMTLSLGAESKAVLAHWAHKTAVSLVAATPGGARVVPEQHRRAIRDDGSPGQAAWIAFFAWQGEPVLGTGEFQIAMRGSAEGERNGYLAFLAFAGVGFAVVASDGLRDQETIDTDFPLARFWPSTTGYESWPPPTVDNRVLPALLNFNPLRAKGSPR